MNTKSKTLSVLKNELQVLFNKFIRTRDKDKPCIYCGKPVNPKGKDGQAPSAAHFFPVSTSEAIRFDERNAALAHLECNCLDDRVAYKANLIARIGIEDFDVLEGLQHSLAKFSRFEIEEKINGYK